MLAAGSNWRTILVVRALISSQVRLSQWVDSLLPVAFRKDGHLTYTVETVPRYLKPKLRIYDVGGGKRPYLSAEEKGALEATVVGIDIDANELAQSPAGAYDSTIAADIASFSGAGDADLVICQAVLEHVENVDEAMRALASILKPGGTALVFVPCRNAAFARLNLLLPESAKQSILFALYPRMKQHQGFPSYYRDCTPSGLSRLATKHGLDVKNVETYWTSAYFYAFFPAYVLWRGWLIAARSLGLRNLCETFSIVLQKPINVSA
jgi:SAM-dependent methyltransferase